MNNCVRLTLMLRISLLSYGVHCCSKTATGAVAAAPLFGLSTFEQGMYLESWTTRTWRPCQSPDKVSTCESLSDALLVR